MSAATRCVHAVWIGACPTCRPVHTSRDQAWHFTHPTLGHIDSKGEFDRRCKAQGLVRVSTDELLTRGKPTTPALPKVSSAQIGEIVRDLKQRAANPAVIEQKWRETQAKVQTPISPVGVEMVHQEA